LNFNTRKGIITWMSEEYILAASILIADLTRIGEIIQEAQAAGVDWIHFDVMDGHFVPNLAMGPALVESCRRITELPLDVHLMIDNPEKFLQKFADAGADNLTVHVEVSPHLHRTLNSIHELGMQAGVALNPGTPASAITEVVSLVDMIKVMTVNPGFAGQVFIESTLNKIRTIRELIEATDSKARIQVDGGISTSTAPLAAAAGANIFVASKAIFKHPEGIRGGVDALRASLAQIPAHE
jgi:ribulose-phosphate 3-epimerase